VWAIQGDGRCINVVHEENGSANHYAYHALCFQSGSAQYNGTAAFSVWRLSWENCSLSVPIAGVAADQGSSKNLTGTAARIGGLVVAAWTDVGRT